MSDVSVAFTPVALLGIDALIAAHDHASRGAAVDALLVGEATVLALDVNELGKLLAARERPAVWALRLRDVPRTRTSDDFLSFYSGHTTSIFAMAAPRVSDRRPRVATSLTPAYRAARAA